MAKFEFLNTISRAAHKVGFGIKKHSPEIMVVAGVAGGVAATVMACKATTKLSAIMEHHKQDVENIQYAMANPEALPEAYSEEDGKRDLVIVHTHTALELVKLYGPSVALGALSITSILAGHHMLHKRNVALAAAYTAVDKGFKAYRGRVIERFGKELDRELRLNIKAKEVEEQVVDEQTGEVKTVTTVVEEVGPDYFSPYARCFDKFSELYNTEDREKNLFFLLQQQNYANEKLKSRGYLSLNEVYEMLGFQVTKAGSAVGWVYDPENTEYDSYVDFGIHDLNDPQKRLFVNGHEPCIWLDFNVGPMWDRMK